MRSIRHSEMCGLPAALLKTIDRLDHGVSSLNFGISREFPSNFASGGPRDSLHHYPVSRTPRALTRAQSLKSLGNPHLHKRLARYTKASCFTVE